MNTLEAWGTTDELDFIRSLGKFSAVGKVLGKEELLKGYLDSCEKRTDWRRINKKLCIEVAIRCLGRTND